MRIDACFEQQIGRRERQEDRGQVVLDTASPPAERFALAVVCDGMGGMAFGEDASKAGVVEFVRHFRYPEQGETPRDRLSRAIKYANREVYYQADTRDAIKKMGTTIAAAVVFGNKLFVANVGDSRVYVCRASSRAKLEQLSFDHTFEKKLQARVAAGSMSSAEAEAHPAKASLTSHLGLLDLPDEHYSPAPITLSGGDWVLVCSDGLYGTLDDSKITEELFGTAQAAAQRLIKKTIAANAPEQDNVSVALLLMVPEEPSPSAGPAQRSAVRAVSSTSAPSASKQASPSPSGRIAAAPVRAKASPTSDSGRQPLRSTWSFMAWPLPAKIVVFVMAALPLLAAAYYALRPKPTGQKVLQEATQKGFRDEPADTSTFELGGIRIITQRPPPPAPPRPTASASPPPSPRPVISGARSTPSIPVNAAPSVTATTTAATRQPSAITAETPTPLKTDAPAPVPAPDSLKPSTLPPDSTPLIGSKTNPTAAPPPKVQPSSQGASSGLAADPSLK